MSKTYERIQRWLSSVRGKIRGQERRAIYNRDMYQFNDQIDLNTPVMNSEFVYIVEIPEKELDSMLDVRDWYDRNSQGFGINQLDDIVREYYHEKHIRENDERLQELYDQYKTMLALISGKTFELK